MNKEEILNIPAEPSIDELIAQATRELEQKNQDLAFQIIDIDNKNRYLQEEMKRQEEKFNMIVARMVIDFYGR